MATLTYDSRSTNTLTADSRSADGSLTYDSRVTTTNFLWSALTLPWDVNFYPWRDLDGLTLTLDTRN